MPALSEPNDRASAEARPHHRPGGFRNTGAPFEPKGLAALIRWYWHAAIAGLPRAPLAPTPVLSPQRAFIDGNASANGMRPAFTWIGHSTMLAQFGGLNWLTDPVFSPRASPLGFIGPKRAQPPALSIEQLPRIDVVLISHNHYDHLDEPSVVALAGQAGGPPLFVVPLGLARWFVKRGIDRVVELDWWDVHRIDAAASVDIVFTPARHWSGRGLHDRMATLWGGFAAFAPDFHFFYSGDSAYSADFAAIREHFADRQPDGGFDLAMLPIGAYEPRWFMRDQHVNPSEAVRVHEDVGAKRSVGVHWGTFSLTDEALDEPPRALAEARQARDLADEDFFVMAIGETRVFAPRATSAAGGPP